MAQNHKFLYLQQRPYVFTSFVIFDLCSWNQLLLKYCVKRNNAKVEKKRAAEFDEYQK